MTVAILPHGYPNTKFGKLSSIPLSVATLLSGDKSFKKEDSTLGDLGRDDHVIMLVSSRSLTARMTGLKCNVSLSLAEPPAIQQRYYRLLPLVASRYHAIFTHSHKLLSQIRNARFVHHGGCSISLSPLDSSKSKMLSMIVSQKRSTIGHRLRHRIATTLQNKDFEADILGRGFKPVSCVSEALTDYKFSVVIENSRSAGYFSEKLIDCLTCRTVPVYWGDPCVDRVFDNRGIIQVSCIAEFNDILPRLNNGLYEKMLPFVTENFNRARDFHSHMIVRAATELLKQELLQVAA